MDAGGSLSGAFTVPATGVAVVTFSTCGIVLDAVLDGIGHGTADACFKCDGNNNSPHPARTGPLNKNNALVSIQIASRSGATIPVRVRCATIPVRSRCQQ